MVCQRTLFFKWAIPALNPNLQDWRSRSDLSFAPQQQSPMGIAKS